MSVIVPIYKVESFIERCARSLFGQTLDDIEYIFIDDCSPDNSINILKQVLDEYPYRKANVLIVTMPTNCGSATVRRHGVQLATGEYIIHCDSDDWVDVNMYKLMYETACREKVDLVVCDYAIVDDVSVIKTVDACHSSSPKQMIENALLHKDSWTLCNKLFNKKVYHDIIYPQQPMGEDMVLTLQLLWNSTSLSYVAEPFYKYYNNLQSITKVCTKASYISKYEQLLANSQIVFDFIKGKTFSEDFDQVLVVYKNFIRSLLYPIIGDIKYYKLWKGIFPKLNCQVLRSKHISLLEKIRVILALLRLYRHDAK